MARRSLLKARAVGAGATVLGSVGGLAAMQRARAENWTEEALRLLQGCELHRR
jgi:hypothetical protein